MEHTYNYLKTVCQNLKQENKSNPSLIFIVLVLWCIPLSYAFNSMALVALVGFSLYSYKKATFSVNPYLLLPVGLFLLMSLSLLWTNDISASIRAWPKGLPLLLIPICFGILPKLTEDHKQKVLRYFSYGIVLFTLFYMLKALLRFAMTHEQGVFFYHELVTEDVNAIHVSVYVVMALFFFVTKPFHSVYDKTSMVLLTVFLILLSSKNIIIIFFVLAAAYYFMVYKTTLTSRMLQLVGFFLALLIMASIGKIRDRFLIEFQSNTSENTINYDIGTITDKVYNVSVAKAWTQDKFNQNDFFPGTAFRVYQLRIFIEMLQEDPIFFTGYGLNATDFKIIQKRIEHQLYGGYEKKNFHNEYIQIFAELGIFGFVILVLMLFFNIKNALKTKDFMHISFAVLMISLFLTESFLSRQRGLVFFSMLYCLFNAQIWNVAPTTK